MAEGGGARSSARDLLYLSQVGLLAGGGAGLAEFIFMRVTERGAFPLSDLLPYVLFYGLVWALFGAASGLVLVSLARVKRWSSSWTRAVGFSVTMGSVPAGLLGAYANARILPDMLAGSSLLFDALLLVVSAAVAFGVLKVVTRRACARPSAARRRSPLAVATAGWICILVVAALAPARLDSPAEVTAQRPPGDLNILLLVVDALRPDHLGCYGYERATSPNIDRLAREGVLFANAYTQAPTTKASTASLVTSLYPSSHRVRGITDGLPDATPLLMVEMRRMGYRTALLSANAFLSPLFGFGRGVDYSFAGEVELTRKAMIGRTLRQLAQRFGPVRWLATCIDGLERVLPRSGKEISPYEEQAARLNDNLLHWIDASPGKQFFAYVQYMEPHMPLGAPPPYDTMFGGRRAAPRTLQFPVATPGVLPFAVAPSLPESERSRLVAQYDATIAYFDAELGYLLTALEERELLERTLIVITADHGEGFYEHGGWGHGNSVFEELIRVPLVVWCPRYVPRARRLEECVRLVDIMPTLLGASGCPPTLFHAELEGVNLWSVLTSGVEMRSSLPVLSEQGEGSDVTRALRIGTMKLICAESDGRQRLLLFDLAADPHETNDLAALMPDVRDALYSQLARMREEADGKQKISRVRQLDEATTEAFKTLGYLR